MPTMSTATVAPAPNPSKPVRPCSWCGLSNEPHSKACWWCGLPLDAGRSSGAGRPTAHASRCTPCGVDEVFLGKTVKFLWRSSKIALMHPTLAARPFHREEVGWEV
jgi:hypothetical protein